MENKKQTSLDVFAVDKPKANEERRKEYLRKYQKEYQKNISKNKGQNIRKDTGKNIDKNENSLIMTLCMEKWITCMTD